jgi:hypothetical protein
MQERIILVHIVGNAMSWPSRKIHHIGEYDANDGLYSIAFTRMESYSVAMFVSLSFVILVFPD